MRALGELLLYRPVAGSFASYAEEFVGPWAGFFTGWSYLPHAINSVVVRILIFYIGALAVCRTRVSGVDGPA
jgi:L-asparagine transporter-like permease